MHQPEKTIAQLFSIRNRYGKDCSIEKLKLLQALENNFPKNKTALHSLYSILLFLLAYPDNRKVYKLASQTLQQLQQFIQSQTKIQAALYNSGITNTNLCASFSFEIVKWMRKNYPDDIRLSEMEADDGQISSILSVVMPKVESEILQDGNAGWKPWLMQSLKKDETLLDKLIEVFDQTNIRPEVKDELWGALGINVEIYFSQHTCLPASLFIPYVHRSLINKKNIGLQPTIKPVRIDLNEQQAGQIIACARIVLMRQLREIDPISFTSAKLVSYYQLDRGISIALMGMVTERRHPIDSYMGYVVFKNGLPLAYAACWILFDSARIGLNVFADYRGGESAYIFQQVLKLHKQVYKLNRFTVDPYQLGKDNADGIHSGAFWMYYHAGFRPIEKLQKQLATTEAKKINETPGYRTVPAILKKLAESRMEMVLKNKAVRFDAVDVSRAYAHIINAQFNNNRKLAETYSYKKLVNWLQLKNQHDDNMHFIVTNWAVLLFNKKMELPETMLVKKNFKNLLAMKANGREEDYINAMQQFVELRKFMEDVATVEN